MRKLIFLLAVWSILLVSSAWAQTVVIDGVPIGTSNPKTGKFTNLEATTSIKLGGDTVTDFDDINDNKVKVSSGDTADFLNNQFSSGVGISISADTDTVTISSTGSGQLTTKGDVLIHNGTSETRLPVGASGQYLTSDTSNNLLWANPPEGDQLFNSNVLLNAYRTAENGSRPILKMVDGVVDAFENSSGVDAAASTNENYDSTANLYNGEPSDTLTSNFESGGSGTHIGKVTQRTRDGAHPVGQTFRVASSGDLSKFTFFMTRVGNPTDNVRVKIYSVSGGFPNTLLATSQTISGTTLTLSVTPYDFIFSSGSRPTLSTGTDYAAVLERTGSLSDTDRYFLSGKFSHEASPYYNDGRMIEDIGSGWANTSNADDDYKFRAYLESGVSNITVISNSQSAKTAPNGASILLFAEDVDANITLNTDVKAYVSRDDGTTFSQVTLSDAGEFEKGNLLTGSVDISSQPSGTDMQWKVETFNSKALNLHGVGLEWR